MRGILTDNGLTSLNGDSKISENQIKVNDVIIDKKDTKANDLLGNYVEAYYHFTDDTKTLVYLKMVEDKNDVLTISAPDIISAGVTEITYNANAEKSKKAKISVNADYIYNGKAVLGIKAEDLNIPHGSLRLIDYDNDDVYDVLFINRFRTMVFLNTNETEDVLFGKYGEKVDLSKVGDVRVTKNSEKIKISDIKPYDVLALMITSDSAAIEICTNIVYGKLSEITDDEYLVGDGKYRIATEYENSTMDKPVLGVEGTFYLGKDNVLAYYEQTSSKIMVMATKFSCDSSPLKVNPHIRVFDTNSKWNTYGFEKKITYNGKKIESDDLVDQAELFNADGFIRQIVLIEIGEQGNISSLETADSTRPDEDVLQTDSDVRTYNYCSSGTYTINPATTIPNQDNRYIFVTKNSYFFKIPSDADKELFYSVNKGSAPYEHNTNIPNAQVYFSNLADKKSSNASCIVQTVESSLIGDWNQRSSVVIRIGESLDADGMPRQTLYTLTNGAPENYFAADGMVINGLRAGDIVQLTANDSEIVRYRKAYSSYYHQSCVEYYLSHTQEQLKDFYYITDINTVDDLNHYINKEIILDRGTYANRSNKTSMNTDAGTQNICGKVIYKEGNFITVQTSEGKTFPFLLDPNNFYYYQTKSYRFKEAEKKATVIDVKNVCLDDWIYIFSEAFSAIDLMIVE